MTDLTDVINGMDALRCRLTRNRDVRTYRETAEQLYEEKVTWLAQHGARGLAIHYQSWLDKYRDLYPMSEKQQ